MHGALRQVLARGGATGRAAAGHAEAGSARPASGPITTARLRRDREAREQAQAVALAARLADTAARQPQAPARAAAVARQPPALRPGGSRRRPSWVERMEELAADVAGRLVPTGAWSDVDHARALVAPRAAAPSEPDDGIDLDAAPSDPDVADGEGEPSASDAVATFLEAFKVGTYRYVRGAGAPSLVQHPARWPDGNTTRAPLRHHDATSPKRQHSNTPSRRHAIVPHPHRHNDPQWRREIFTRCNIPFVVAGLFERGQLRRKYENSALQMPRVHRVFRGDLRAEPGRTGDHGENEG